MFLSNHAISTSQSNFRCQGKIFTAHTGGKPIIDDVLRSTSACNLFSFVAKQCEFVHQWTIPLTSLLGNTKWIEKILIENCSTLEGDVLAIRACSLIWLHQAAVVTL
jgi:hypothetical protein